MGDKPGAPVPSARHTPALPTGRQILTTSCGRLQPSQRSLHGRSRAPIPPLRELISCWMALEGSMSDGG